MSLSDVARNHAPPIEIREVALEPHAQRAVRRAREGGLLEGRRARRRERLRHEPNVLEVRNGQPVCAVARVVVVYRGPVAARIERGLERRGLRRDARQELRRGPLAVREQALRDERELRVRGRGAGRGEERRRKQQQQQ